MSCGTKKPMTEDELSKLLGGEKLEQVLDIKTLVLDQVRKMNDEELMIIFWSKLSEMSTEEIKDYYYMRRN